MDYSIVNTYAVYYDSECQCELDRFMGPFFSFYDDPQKTPEYQTWLNNLDQFGGGNYNVYYCMVGWRIQKVKSRTPETGDKLVMILVEE